MQASLVLNAQGIYQTNEDFLSQVFNDNVPKPKALWLKSDLKAKATDILGEKPPQLRVRYWRTESKSAWILEAIGKERLITMGFVIQDQKITRTKVLAFRETRGWEIKHQFFTDQFKQVSLDKSLKLSHSIDGIAGATLSVRAAKKMARLALLFNGSLPEY